MPPRAPRWPHGALAGMGVASAAAGLLGARGSLIWIVAGVWTTRIVWGRRPGLAWGCACIAVAVRWGTLDLRDIFAATGTLGPTVLVGPPLTAVGVALAFGAAMLEESGSGLLRAPDPPERVTAGTAVVTLVALFLAPGVGAREGSALGVSLAIWVVAAAACSACVIALAPVSRRVPAVIPAFGALAGGALVALGSGGWV